MGDAQPPSAKTAKSKILKHAGEEQRHELLVETDDSLPDQVHVFRRPTFAAHVGSLSLLHYIMVVFVFTTGVTTLYYGGQPLALSAIDDVATDRDGVLFLCLDLLLMRGAWRFCSGLNGMKYKDLKLVDPAVQTFAVNGSVIRHASCCESKGFFLAAQRDKTHTFADGSMACYACYTLSRSLNSRITTDMTAHIDSSTHVRWDVLPDDIAFQRHEHLRGRVHALGKKYQRSFLKVQDLQASAEEAQALIADLRAVQEKMPMQFEQVMNEQETIKETWQSSIQELTKGVGNGKGSRYSPLLIRIALAVYARSPAALQVLIDFKVIPVPSKSTLLRYANVHRHGAGMSETFLVQMAESVERFKAVCATRNIPWQNCLDGAIIIDEIVINGGVAYNPISHKIVGLAQIDLCKLDDLFKDPAADHDPADNGTTKHIMQTLFRCAAVDFELLGPYFSTSTVGDHRIVKHAQEVFGSALMEFGFQPNLTILDGSAPNQSFIKQVIDVKFRIDMTQDELLNWIPATRNWLGVKGKTMIYMICPAHQMKNMVNALHHSQQHGTRAFVFSPADDMSEDLEQISWSFLEDCWERDNIRQKNNLLRHCPKLTLDAIERPAFAKLNVGLALVPIQGQVAYDIVAHMVDSGDWRGQRTVSFLLGMMRTFTFGLLYRKLSIHAADNAFLGSPIPSQASFSGTYIAPPRERTAAPPAPAPVSHVPVDDPELDENAEFHPSAYGISDTDTDSSNFEIGTFFEFFMWLLQWRANVEQFRVSNNLQAVDVEKLFLADQTFFLQCVLTQGFRAYAAEFFRIHKDDGARLFPIRFTGSALELIFCNFRQLPGRRGAISEEDYQKAYSIHLLTQECNADRSSYALEKGTPSSRASLTPTTARSLRRKHALADITNQNTPKKSRASSASAL
jgi:hypothetical protein